jgi:hypothetical protein
MDGEAREVGSTAVPGLCRAAPSRPQNQADAQHMTAHATSMGALGAGICRRRRLQWLRAVLTAGHAQGGLSACNQGPASMIFGRMGGEMQPAIEDSCLRCFQKCIPRPRVLERTR